MNKDGKLSIVWNLTQYCCWNCSFCCVDAKTVKNPQQFNADSDVNFFLGDELNYSEKLKVIDQLERGKYTIDFSGGELFLDPLNLEVILYASDNLGAENVGISTSGSLMPNEIIKKFSTKVSDVELSIDYIPFEFFKLRPTGYHEFAANAIEKLKEAGIRVGVQTVLTKENIDRDKLYQLFKWLEKKGVDDWSLLRFFPVGRGKNFYHLTPSFEEYCDVVDYLKSISYSTKLNVHFQYLLPNHENYTLDCRALKKSIGILPNGIAVGCFWNFFGNHDTDEDIFYLGKLPEENLKDIFSGERANFWKNNHHKCIFFKDDLFAVCVLQETGKEGHKVKTYENKRN